MSSTKTLTIQGVAFQAPLKYSDGVTINSTEASVLNAAFHRDLASKLGPTIKAAKESGHELDMTALQDQLLAFAKTHEFSTGRSGSTYDPVQREAFKILRPMILNAIKKKGIDTKTLPDGKLEELMLNALAKRPDILEEAKRRASTVKDLADDAIGLE